MDAPTPPFLHDAMDAGVPTSSAEPRGTDTLCQQVRTPTWHCARFWTDLRKSDRDLGKATAWLPTAMRCRYSQ